MSDIDRAALAEIGHPIGGKALMDLANADKLDTILGWYRGLIVGKFDGSKRARYLGRPRMDGELDQLVVRMASENRD